jgi:hypothetical protein
MIYESAELEAKIVDAIYRGACDAEELSRAVAMIGRYFSSAAVSLALVDLSQKQINRNNAEGQLLLSWGVVGPAELDRYQEYAALDPIPPLFIKIAPGTITTSDRILPRDDGSIFRNEYLAPLGIDENLGGPLFRANGRCAAISVLKGIHQDDFGDNDIARLARLAPHVTRALQLRRLFLQSEARGKTLDLIVDRNETGLIGLGNDGTSIFVNAAARATAAARDGLAVDRFGKLVAADRAAATRLASLQSDVVRGGAGGVAIVPRPSGLPPYAVLVSPLPARDDLFPPGLLLAIHDPTRRPTATADRIAQLLHVPPGAARLVQALLEGLDLKEYADRAGISINTVRSHLKVAFARTETRSQADLMRRTLSVLNDLGPYFAKAKPQ